MEKLSNLKFKKLNKNQAAKIRGGIGVNDLSSVEVTDLGSIEYGEWENTNNPDISYWVRKTKKRCFENCYYPDIQYWRWFTKIYEQILLKPIC